MPSPEDMSVEDFENRLSRIKSSIAEDRRTRQENKQIKEIEHKSLPNPTLPPKIFFQKIKP